jgi:hypothetical protein
MPALGGRKQPPRLLQGVVGGHALRFVEQKHAIDLFPGFLTLGCMGRLFFRRLIG